MCHRRRVTILRDAPPEDDFFSERSRQEKSDQGKVDREKEVSYATISPGNLLPETSQETQFEAQHSQSSPGESIDIS